MLLVDPDACREVRDGDEDEKGVSGIRSSCIVAAILGTWWRFARRVELRGPLLNAHKCGKISFGIPPPWSETRKMTC